jgi:hypothetical protein
MRLQEESKDLEIDDPEADELPHQGLAHIAGEPSGNGRVISLLIGLFVLSGHVDVSD